LASTEQFSTEYEDYMAWITDRDYRSGIFFFFDQRASAAFLAISLRRAFVRDLARALTGQHLGQDLNPSQFLLAQL